MQLQALTLRQRHCCTAFTPLMKAHPNQVGKYYEQVFEHTRSKQITLHSQDYNGSGEQLSDLVAEAKAEHACRYSFNRGGARSVRYRCRWRCARLIWNANPDNSAAVLCSIFSINKFGVCVDSLDLLNMCYQKPILTIILPYTCLHSLREWQRTWTICPVT